MLKFKKMGSDKVPLLLVTANVGSMFEDPSQMLPIWTSEFLQAVSRMDPKFIALHLQEVGGKAYEKSMQYVKDFVQRLCDCPELRLFDKIRIFLDEDFSSPEKFTALGNLYFAHSSLSDLKIWDFDLKTYVDVLSKEVHSGNIEKVTTKEKAKFPQHFFPECKWSRKGYLRTRWMIRGTAVEFVNIHLFHDASNLLALEPHPNVYCRSRRRALRHTLRQLHADPLAAPYFIFGDFNFRTDTGGVVKKVTEDLSACRVQNGASVDSTKLVYRSKADDRLVLTVGKKEFAHCEHQKIFREPWLQRFDRELEALRPHLFEFPVKFPPSYPFEEEIDLPTHYMKTRCPAWCDRVLLSQSARLLVQHHERPSVHASRKSVADSNESSGRVSSSDSSPARSNSPARHTNNQSSPNKNLEKKPSVTDFDALTVPGNTVSRKSIADPTSIQQAISGRTSDEGSPSRRKLVRNQSEGSAADSVSAELRRLVDAPTRRRADYGVIGSTACMGDHKPIYLRVMLQSDRGTVRCCDPRLPCMLCGNLFLPSPTPAKLTRLPTDPDLYYSKILAAKNDLDLYNSKILAAENHLENVLERKNFIDLYRNKLLPFKNDSELYYGKVNNRKLQVSELTESHSEHLLDNRDSISRLKRSRTGSLNEKIFRIPHVEITSVCSPSIDLDLINDIDTSLLSARQCLDPYTPESVDSHTPNVEGASTGSDLSNEVVDILGSRTVIDRNVTVKLTVTRDRSVSPNQLKSRLDRLLEDKSKSHELQRLNSRESCKSGNSKQGGLCCLALKCVRFCRRRARKVACDCSGFKCTS